MLGAARSYLVSQSPLVESVAESPGSDLAIELLQTCKSRATGWHMAVLQLNGSCGQYPSCLLRGSIDLVVSCRWLELISIELCSAVKVVGGHQQLQAELTWNFRVGDAGLLTVFLVVVQVFDDLLQDDPVHLLEMTHSAERLAEVACELLASLL